MRWRRSRTSLGPGVPSIVVSPLNRRTDVSNELLDHTSSLPLVGEVFPGDAGAPSKFLAERIDQGVASVGRALTQERPAVQAQLPELIEWEHLEPHVG